MSERMFNPGDTVYHAKSNGYYEIQANDAIIEAVNAPCYVYKGADGRLWVRSVAQMEDGRFTLENKSFKKVRLALI